MVNALRGASSCEREMVREEVGGAAEGEMSRMKEVV